MNEREIVKMMNQYRQEREKRTKCARTLLTKTLRSVGVERVDVEFDGSGDSGQIEAIIYSPDKPKEFGKTEVPDTPHEAGEWTDSGYKQVVRNYTLNELVEEFCYGLLSGEHPGWEINDGSYGGFVIDVKNDKVALNYNQRVESVESYDEEY